MLLNATHITDIEGDIIKWLENVTQHDVTVSLVPNHIGTRKEYGAISVCVPDIVASQDAVSWTKAMLRRLVAAIPTLSPYPFGEPVYWSTTHSTIIIITRDILKENS